MPLRLPAFDRRALFVVTLAVATRLVYFATTTSPSFADPLIDGDYYDYLGGRIAAGEGFEPGPFWQPPLYPLILGALYRVLGHDLYWPRLLQAACDGLTAYLVLRIATRITRSTTWGMLAGVAVALHGPMLFYAGEILPTCSATCLGLVALWFAVALEPGRRRSVLTGAAVGAASLLVAPMLVMIAPLGWLLGKSRWQQGALAAAACVALVGCATLANHVRSDETVLISANGGVNLWIGNAPDSDRLVAVRPGAEWEELSAEPERAGVTSLGGQDAYFVDKATAACTGDVVGCGARLLSKARQLLRSQEIPRNESLDVVGRDAWLLRALDAGIGSARLPYVVLLPLGAVGVVVALRRKRRTERLVALTALSLAAVPVVFFVTGRYRAPLAPQLVVLAALGASMLWHEWRARQLETVVGAFVLVLAAQPLHLPVDDVPFESEMHYVIGGRHARLGDDRGAIDAWRRAIALRPDYLEAAFNLGLALERVGERAAAAEAYRALLARHPESREARERLGAIEAR